MRLKSPPLKGYLPIRRISSSQAKQMPRAEKPLTMSDSMWAPNNTCEPIRCQLCLSRRSVLTSQISVLTNQRAVLPACRPWLQSLLPKPASPSSSPIPSHIVSAASTPVRINHNSVLRSCIYYLVKLEESEKCSEEEKG